MFRRGNDASRHSASARRRAFDEERDPRGNRKEAETKEKKRKEKGHFCDGVCGVSRFCSRPFEPLITRVSLIELPREKLPSLAGDTEPTPDAVSRRQRSGTRLSLVRRTHQLSLNATFHRLRDIKGGHIDPESVGYRIVPSPTDRHRNADRALTHSAPATLA